MRGLKREGYSGSAGAKYKVQGARWLGFWPLHLVPCTLHPLRTPHTSSENVGVAVPQYRSMNPSTVVPACASSYHVVV
jgi:hypothetical protein